MLLRLAAVFSLPKSVITKAAVLAFITRYVFDDWQFLAFLMLFVALDTVTGIVAAFKQGTLRSGKMTPFFYKVFIYGVVLIMTHGLTRFEIHGTVNWAFKFFDALAYTLMMAREALSILENITKIDPALIPPEIRTQLRAAIMAVPLRIMAAFTAQAKANAESVIQGIAPPTEASPPIPETPTETAPEAAV